MSMNSRQKSICQLATADLLPKETKKREKVTKARLGLMQWFLTGGTRTTWGYEEPKQGVRSTKVLRDTRSGNLNQIY